MGKQNNGKKKNRYTEDMYDSKPAAGRGYTKRYEYNSRDDRKQQVEYNPVAILIRDELIGQINHFNDQMDSGVDLKDACEHLLKLSAYPTYLQGCEGAEKYQCYQLERNVYPSKQDPNVLFSPSTIILVTDIETNRPAFLVKAFMNYQRESGTYKSHIVIYEQGDKGTIYGKTLRWVGNNGDKR